MTDVSTTWAEVILRVMWIVSCYYLLRLVRFDPCIDSVVFVVVCTVGYLSFGRVPVMWLVCKCCSAVWLLTSFVVASLCLASRLFKCLAFAAFDLVCCPLTFARFVLLSLIFVSSCRKVAIYNSYDSKDDFRSGCWDVSHCQQQHFLSELHDRLLILLGLNH